MAASSITTADPQFQGNIYVARNITERKRAERRIRDRPATTRSPKCRIACSFSTCWNRRLRGAAQPASLAPLSLDLELGSGGDTKILACRLVHPTLRSRGDDDNLEEAPSLLSAGAKLDVYSGHGQCMASTAAPRSRATSCSTAARQTRASKADAAGELMTAEDGVAISPDDVKCHQHIYELNEKQMTKHIPPPTQIAGDGRLARGT